MNSWWHLDGCCAFLVASRWLMLIFCGIQVVAINSKASRWLPVHPSGIWMVTVNFWWHLYGCCYFSVTFWVVVVHF